MFYVSRVREVVFIPFFFNVRWNIGTKCSCKWRTAMCSEYYKHNARWYLQIPRIIIWYSMVRCDVNRLYYDAKPPHRVLSAIHKSKRTYRMWMFVVSVQCTERKQWLSKARSQHTSPLTWMRYDGGWPMPRHNMARLVCFGMADWLAALPNVYNTHAHTH